MDIHTFHELLDLHSSTLNQIVEQDYYVDTLDSTLDSLAINLDTAHKMTNPEDIQSFWNELWYRLPDSKLIRRGPFFNICDLAEGAYLAEDFGEE